MKLQLVIALSLLAITTFNAQTKEFKNVYFSFKIHDKLEVDETVEKTPGKTIYSSSTIFLDIDEVKSYSNAKKYMDALELALPIDVKVSNRMDSLGGRPVMVLHTDQKSDLGTYVRDYFIFDNGSSTFCVSICGWGMDQHIIDSYFAVTRESFKYSTMRHSLADVYVDVPATMGVDKSSNLIWSRVYNPGEKIDIAIRFNRKPEENYDDAIKEKLKELKKEKALDIVNEVMMVGDLNITMVGGTTSTKLNKGLIKEERSYFYFIKHPAGGISYFFFRAHPSIAPSMLTAVEAIIKSASVKGM